MKKMLKVFVAALLAVSLMASMALTVYAEEPVEDVVEIIEEETVFEEERRTRRGRTRRRRRTDGRAGRRFR